MGWIHSHVLGGGNGTVLDLACGPGLYALRLARRGCRCVGIDFSPVLLSMLPYLLTVAAIVLLSIRSRKRPSPAPAALGQAYRREER